MGAKLGILGDGGKILKRENWTSSRKVSGASNPQAFVRHWKINSGEGTKT
jgi:hypothetical protein